jgi:DNA repair photolyase
LERPSVREVTCKTVLHELDGPREYTANFYKGCTHGCVYCYVPSLIHDDRTWGAFVDAKTNSPAVLDRELGRVRRGVVFLSSASDPYQPLEARYGITRKALGVLARRRFPTVILTRSPLVLRDIDLLRKLEWVRVGFSISSISGRLYEPGVVPVRRRVETLRRLSEAGVKTWVSMAPIVPGMGPFDVDALLGELKSAGVSSVTAGILRFQGYGESRRMFEEATGTSAASAMEGGEEMIAAVRRRVEAHGFEPAESFFHWRCADSLDQFLDQQPKVTPLPIS